MDHGQCISIIEIALCKGGMADQPSLRCIIKKVLVKGALAYFTLPLCTPQVMCIFSYHILRKELHDQFYCPVGGLISVVSRPLFFF